MSDSFRRYSSDDDDLASSTRDDARRWRAFVARSEAPRDPRKRASQSTRARVAFDTLVRARSNEAREAHAEEASAIDARARIA